MTLTGVLKEARASLAVVVKRFGIEAAYPEGLILAFGDELVARDVLALARAVERDLPKHRGDEEATIHAVGPVMHYNTTMRQRCMWCGKCLLSVDVANVSVGQSGDDICSNENTTTGRACGKTRQEHDDGVFAHEFLWQPPEYPTWQPGAFIAQGGGATYVVLDADIAHLTKMSDLAIDHGMPVCLLLPEDWTE